MYIYTLDISTYVRYRQILIQIAIGIDMDTDIDTDIYIWSTAHSSLGIRHIQGPNLSTLQSCL